MNNIAYSKPVSLLSSRAETLLKTGLFAGLVGGAAEIAWISVIAPFSGMDAAAVGREVTGALFPALRESVLALPLGLGLHMGLAIVLGLAVAIALRSSLPARLHGSMVEFGAVVAVLVGVWAVNFFVVLPWLDPTFLTIVPYWAAFVSKALFGLAAAMVLLRRR